MTRDEKSKQEIYKLEMTDTVVGEVFDMLKLQERENGREFAEDLMYSIARSYLASIIITSLSLKFPAKMSEAERFMRKRKSYAETKLRLEAVIGEAFDLALEHNNPKTSPTHIVTVDMIDEGDGPPPRH